MTLEVEGKLYKGAANIGSNPTFGDSSVSYEAHLFDFTGDLYGKFLKMKFIKRVRDEFKFKSTEELKEQIRKDLELVRSVLY